MVGMCDGGVRQDRGDRTRIRKARFHADPLSQRSRDDSRCTATPSRAIRSWLWVRGEAQPQYFLRHEPHNPAEIGLGDLLYCERLIVAHAYAVAGGLRIPESLEMDIEGFREQVTETYRELGLASGEHDAAEMLRDLERQGRLLATQLGR